MNEVQSFVKSGLKDLSISRTSFSWGIKIPEKIKSYNVCLDRCITNYLSSLGYPKLDKDKSEYWQECIHIIGKGYS